MSLSDILDPSRYKIVPDAEINKPETSGAERFAARCNELGLDRYARELAAIERKKLPHFALFGQWRKLWRNRDHSHDSAIIYGSTDAGKSVMALWACRDAFRAAGGFAWFDAVEMPGILMREDSWECLKWIAAAPLLVIDEVGDVPGLKNRSWVEIKNRINLRYRADKPTILCSIEPRSKLLRTLGPEVLRRFALTIGDDK